MQPTTFQSSLSIGKASDTGRVFVRRRPRRKPDIAERSRKKFLETLFGCMGAAHLATAEARAFLPSDAANVILSAVGYNLRLVLAWLRTILRVVLLALFQTFAIRLALKPAF